MSLQDNLYEDFESVIGEGHLWYYTIYVTKRSAANRLYIEVHLSIEGQYDTDEDDVVESYPVKQHVLPLLYEGNKKFIFKWGSRNNEVLTSENIYRILYFLDLIE